jgi:hypothetical protein
LENFLSYPQGNFEVKTPSPPIGYPDPSIGGVPILNGMAHLVQMSQIIVKLFSVIVCHTQINKSFI